MIKTLPIHKAELTIRLWERKDLDELAKWPGYPFPYESMNFSFREMSSEEKDHHFRSREERQNRITLIIDHATQSAIGYLSLVQIDWAGRKVGNMAFRIHPLWCNKGIGTRVIRKVSSWCFKCGLKALRLDVTASNAPAIRCYEKAGYVKTEEFWHDDEDLNKIDMEQSRYDFLRPHVRLDGEVPQIRFWWMELRKKDE
ncbi:MAG: GNAT family N-acetyltransferase [Candidatus Edwardsbacteria bacterium]